MSHLILSQSAHGRAIDCTDLILGNINFLQESGAGNESKMIALLHKPAVPAAGSDFVPEAVILVLSNPGDSIVECRVDFNGGGLETVLDPGQSKTVRMTVQGYGSEAVVSIRKEKGDSLFVSGGVRN